MNILDQLLRLRLITIFFLFVTLTQGLIVCQTFNSLKTNHTLYSIGVGFGFNDCHIKDEYLSPEPFRGTMFSSALSLQAKLERSRHAVEIYYSTGHLDSENPQLDITQKIGSLSYSFKHSLDSWNFIGSPLELSLGGGISSFVMNTWSNLSLNLSQSCR